MNPGEPEAAPGVGPPGAPPGRVRRLERMT